MTGNAFLGRAQPRLGEMLRRAPAPNQASFDGLKMKSGRLARFDDFAREDDLVAQLEAALPQPPGSASVSGPGPASKSLSPGASRERPIADRIGRIGRYSP